MIKSDVTVQILMCNALRQDQFKFLYEVHKTVYDTGLKNIYINKEKNEQILKYIIPEITALHSLLNIMQIEDAMKADTEAAIAKEQRKQELMALTGIDFDKEPELDIQMPGDDEKKKEPKSKPKKKKEVEEDPEAVEAKRLAEEKEHNILKFGRTWIWEEYWDESNQEIQDAWKNGVLGLRQLNHHVLEDLEDYILLKGMNGLSIGQQTQMIEDNLLERRQRNHMRVLEAAKDTASAEESKVEGAEIKVQDPVKEGVVEDKKRQFMTPYRPDQMIWNFEIEEDEEKVDHVLRPGADPRKCYIDGRVEKLLECIGKIGSHLKTHNEQMWHVLESHTLDIFYTQEKDLAAAMKNYGGTSPEKH